MYKAIHHIPKLLLTVFNFSTTKILSSLLLLYFIPTGLSSQTRLPSFTGTDLNGNKVTFSQSFEGRKTLVGFAFSQKVQSDLQSWLEPIYYELIDTNSLASLVYDADVYLVICFTKTNLSFRNKVKKELIENVLPECYANVVLTEADAGLISSGLGIKDKSVPHLYALNKSGSITYYVSGAYSERKFEKLTEYLEID